jgi:hypothetical protein
LFQKDKRLKMNLKKLIRKCILETHRERIVENGESTLPLFVLSGGANQDVKEVHIASEDNIKELFSFVGDGVYEVYYEDGELIIIFWEDSMGNISWKDYARLEKYMEEVSNYYMDEGIPEIITGWNINTVRRQINISFSEDDYEIYL